MKASGFKIGAALLALVTTSCADKTPRDVPPQAAVHDSAGIRIVEHSAEVLDAAPRWTLDTAHVLDIGGEGDAHKEFAIIRSVARLSTGEFVVANGGSNEIRIFDTTGAFLHNIGRKGTGPGEFEMLGWATVVGNDSIVARDASHERIQVFASNGNHARGFRVSLPTLQFPESQLLLGDGSVLAIAGRLFTLASPTGVYRDSVTLNRVSARGDVLLPLATVLGGARMAITDKNGVTSIDQSLGPTLEIAAHDSTLYVGASDHYEIRALRLDGTSRMIIRADVPPVAATDIELKIAKAELAGSSSGSAAQSASRRRISEAMQYPRLMPAHSTIKTDADGNVWVRNYNANTNTNSVWRIFGNNGVLRARVELPARFTPQWIRANDVSGVCIDANDVEHVRTYRMVKHN